LQVLTNLHSFLVIVTNHAGDDLYRFERHCTPRSATFYLRQIISSANFSCASASGRATHGFLADLSDFHHGWLNYQIEHHLWPDLSMLSYQKAAPLVKAICAKHGVPYVQQSVWWRLKQTVDVMVGSASMRRYPSKWEVHDDLTLPDEATHTKVH
jgi:fatty acid desaturase